MINIQLRSEKELDAPEITPLIDIVFIVIVFLLITANSPLLTLPIDLPNSDQQSSLQVGKTAELTVTITAERPYWHLEEQAFNNWNEFKRALLLKTNSAAIGRTNDRTATKSTSVIIAADKAAPSEPLLQLLALLNQKKIANAKIIMQQSSY